MLRLIPKPIHRTGLRIAHALRRQWWQVRARRLSGCRIVALDDDGQVLLIRHSYGSGLWMPPGGGLARGESALAAARRELAEETGCHLTGALLITVVKEDLHRAQNQVHIVGGRVAGPPVADGREVIEAAFFAADALPADLPPKLRASLAEWITAVTAAHPFRGAGHQDRFPARKA